MSLEKSIKHYKERRKQYRGSSLFDRSCRPNGGCGWCEQNRTFQDKKARTVADEQVKELTRDDNDDHKRDI